ncbi:MAG: hypothetical protein M1815_001603 [Lichina confinis]|nr:MAG: hypothetical protein M1815_001603 [Lichina confinis]
MSRNRDPLAPTGLSEQQLSTIRSNPRVKQLRQKRLELNKEMRQLYGSVANAKSKDEILARRHIEVVKELAKVRASLRRESYINAKEDYHDTMPTLELEKQISQLEQKSDFDPSDEEDAIDTDLEPPAPHYTFEERARIADAFWGSGAEITTEGAAHAREIQVIQDLATLCEHREPSRRDACHLAKAPPPQDTASPWRDQHNKGNASAPPPCQHPDICIIDKASQALESDCFKLLNGVVRAIILVGDEKQLAPTVLSSASTQNEFREQIALSLFGHLKRAGLPHVLLDQQYRAVHEITAHTNRVIYHSLVRNDIRVEDRPNAVTFRAWAWQHWGTNANKLFFDVTNGHAERDLRASFSRYNDANIDCTFTLVRLLFEAGFRPGQITVLTPHNAQRRNYLLCCLTQQARTHPEVVTIDSFQGRENDIVILDLVMTGSDPEQIGFIRSLNQPNISRTRAQDSMILIGHQRLIANMAGINPGGYRANRHIQMCQHYQESGLVVATTEYDGSMTRQLLGRPEASQEEPGQGEGAWGGEEQSTNTSSMYTDTGGVMVASADAGW